MDSTPVIPLQIAFAQPFLLAADPPAGALIWGLLTLLSLIILFFISTAEVAFFSMNFKEVNLLKTRKDTSWKRIADLLEQPRLLMASLRIASTVANIALILLLNSFISSVVAFDGKFGAADWQLLIKVPVITGLLLLFGSVLPKIRAAQNPIRAAYESAQVAELIYYLFRRVARSLDLLSQKAGRWVGGERDRAMVQEQIEEAIRTSVPEEDEQRLLKGIYKFPHTTVRQIMRIRLDVSGISFDSAFGEVKKKIGDLHYSRLPVFRGSLDQIKGIIHTKDVLPFLDEADSFDWHHLIRPPYFVPEKKPIEDLLKEFQTRRIHFAIVVDEFGGTSGIVTLEDILEEIVGDIRDEFDDEESPNKRLDDGSFIMEGRLMIHEACTLMGLPLTTFNAVKGNGDSLAGLVLEQTGSMPEPGAVIRLGDFIFTVLETGNNRILRVRIQIAGPAQGNGPQNTI